MDKWESGILPIEGLGAMFALGIVIYALVVITRNIDPPKEPTPHEHDINPLLRVPPPY